MLSALHNIVALVVVTLVVLQTQPSTNQVGTASQAEIAWGPPAEGCKLGLQTRKQNYSPGDAVMLAVVLRNDGQHSVWHVLLHPLVEYKIEVLLPDGKRAPLTLYGQLLTEASRNTGAAKHELRPGEEIQQTYVLSQLYDMTLPGEYRITATGNAFRDKRNAESIFPLRSGECGLTIERTTPF